MTRSGLCTNTVVPVRTTTEDARVAIGPAGGRVDEMPTVIDFEAAPPAPSHVSVNVVCVVRGPATKLPDAGSEPFQPPLAIQASEFVAVHVRVSFAASATTAELALNDMSGGCGAPTTTSILALAVPPGPVHEMEY